MKKHKALILTSNKLRHQYLIHQVSKNFEIIGYLSEPKKEYYVEQRQASNNIEKHFQTLDEYERKYFPQVDLPKMNTKLVDRKKLNDDEVIRWAKDLQPDVLFLFGTGILSEQWIKSFPNKIINLHLGLAPYYKGSATLFWPFYNEDLAHLGTTIHLANEKVDSGAILKTVTFTELERVELPNYYHITSQLIKKSLEDFPKIVLQYLEGNLSALPQEKLLNSKIYKRKDFSEEILLKVLQVYGEK